MKERRKRKKRRGWFLKIVRNVKGHDATWRIKDTFRNQPPTRGAESIDSRKKADQKLRDLKKKKKYLVWVQMDGATK
jgi:hypothetical protein